VIVKAYLLPLMLASSVVGCAASIPPVEVTRFNNGQPIAPGGFTIMPLAGVDGQSIEFRTYAAAVSRELTRLGFAEGGTAAYIAEVEFARTTRVDPVRRSPVTIGIGGGSFGGNVGVGVGTSFGLGKNKQRETVMTRLAVKIRKRADSAVVWEGRAVTQAGSNAPAAQPGLAADKLASGLFKGFPGRSGETITVP
jgi:hypothetical protein